MLAEPSKVLYVCTPNNPTGTVTPLATLRHAGRTVRGRADRRRGVRRVRRRVGGAARARVRPRAGGAHHVQGVRAGRAARGLRRGTAGAGARGGEVARTVQGESLSEQVATAAVRDDRRVGGRSTWRWPWRCANGWPPRCARAGFAPLPSGANFVCVPVPQCVAVGQAMRARGVAVRPFPDLPHIGDALRILRGTVAAARTVPRRVRRGACRGTGHMRRAWVRRAARARAACGVTVFDYEAGNLHSLVKALETPFTVVRVDTDPARRRARHRRPRAAGRGCVHTRRRQAGARTRGHARRAAGRAPLPGHLPGHAAHVRRQRRRSGRRDSACSPARSRACVRDARSADRLEPARGDHAARSAAGGVRLVVGVLRQQLRVPAHRRCGQARDRLHHARDRSLSRGRARGRGGRCAVSSREVERRRRSLRARLPRRSRFPPCRRTDGTHDRDSGSGPARRTVRAARGRRVRPGVGAARRSRRPWRATGCAKASGDCTWWISTPPPGRGSNSRDHPRHHPRRRRARAGGRWRARPRSASRSCSTTARRGWWWARGPWRTKTWLDEMAHRFPGRLIVAADVRERKVVTRGWTHTTAARRGVVRGGAGHAAARRRAGDGGAPGRADAGHRPVAHGGRRRGLRPGPCSPAAA